MEHNTVRESKDGGAGGEGVQDWLGRTISHLRDIAIIARLGLFVTSYAWE